jgi:RsiW-degrading membrane proteinase PrsW (M82 family)
MRTSRYGSRIIEKVIDSKLYASSMKNKCTFLHQQITKTFISPLRPKSKSKFRCDWRLVSLFVLVSRSFLGFMSRVYCFAIYNHFSFVHQSSQAIFYQWLSSGEVEETSKKMAAEFCLRSISFIHVGFFSML